MSKVYSEVSKLLSRTTANSRSSVSLCFAQSLNGGMAGSISGNESLEMTHYLRSKHDAILVGVDTIIADNPQLTKRLATPFSVLQPSRNPRPVVLDSKLRIPLESRIANRPGAIIFTEKDSLCTEKEETLKSRGVEIVPCPTNEYGLDLGHILQTMKNGLSLNSTMVEGGGKVLKSFAEQDLVDNYFITVNPSFQNTDVRVQNMNIQLDGAKFFELGEDAFITWSVQYENKERFVDARMPTEFGDVMMRKYSTGEICIYSDLPVARGEHVNVRIHSSCMTSEVFGSTRCDCSWQLREATRIIKQTGGVIVYLNQEGRGIGLSDKLRAYRLQDNGLDTVEANLHLGHEVDYRNFDNCIEILKKDFNIKNICLLSNNPDKIIWAREHFESAKCRPIYPPQQVQSSGMKKYLQTKREKLNHLLPANSNGMICKEKPTQQQMLKVNGS